MNEKIRGLFEVEEKVDLLPYPFCGGEAYITGMFVSVHEDDINAYSVGCENCGISFQQPWIYENIVKKWNMRTCNCKKQEEG